VAVFNRLLFSQIKIIMFVWTAVTLLMLGARLLTQSNILFGALSLTFIILGFYAGILSPKALFIHGRYLPVLKLSAKNLRLFWLMLILQNFIVILLNVVVGFVCAYSIRSNFPQDYMQESESIFSVSGYICIYMILHLLMVAVDCSQSFDRASSSVFDKKTQARQIVLMVFFILFLYVVSLVYKELSPLLAFALGTLVLFVMVMFLNNQIIRSLNRQLQIKFSLRGIGILTLVFSSIAVFEMQTVQSSTFLLVRDYKWTFSDIQKVTTIEEWILWQNKLKSQEVMTVDQLIESYEKVNQYCPPKPRDNPLSVQCEGLNGYRDYQYTSVPLRTEEDVLKLLSSSNEYAQIMGLMYARKLQKPLSRNIIVAVEFIAEKESTIQGLARNTLSNSFPDNYRDGIVFFTKKSPVLQE
jgi:hypothetical protein